MRYPRSKWNPAPESCYTAKATPKIAFAIHRMQGWASYLRSHQNLNDSPPRLVSSHFTLSLKAGDLEQHVDTEHVAWTQGIRPSGYAFAREHWPLFRNRNPNLDCVSIEMGDGAKPFNAKRQLTPEMFEELRDLTRWLFEENIIEGPPVVGESIIGHMQISPMRPDDPGKWFMKNIAPELQAAASGKKRRTISLRPKPTAVKKAKPARKGATDKFRIRVLETRVDKLQDEVARLKGQL